MGCSKKTKIISFIIVGLVFLVLATSLFFSWPSIYNYILTSQLSLSESSTSYKLWKETPIPMYLKLYLFNLTNFQDVANNNWAVKPEFEELGPYVFLEKHTRVDVKWNANNTVDFRQIRNWKFEPELSSGSLDDEITNLNVIAATVANMVKHKNIFIRKAVHYLLKEEGENLFVTHTARELLFDGYEDKLLKLVQNISFLNIPFTRFGWFYGREGNKDYDGLFNMYTGAGSFNQLGIVDRWNGQSETKFYPGECGKVDGTTGEIWPPVKENKNVKLFSSDMCSALTLDFDSETEVKGITGKRFIASKKTFDNGTEYESEACFNVGERIASGARNVSQCRFGAPAFLSFPHFYLADESYREKVIGMNPNRTIHQLHLELEPTTGIPLGVEAKIQINIHIEPINGINMFANAPKVFIPMLWFNQQADLTDDLAVQLKLLLILPNLGTYTSYGMMGIGALLTIIGIFLVLEYKWKENEGDPLIADNNISS